MTKKEIKKAKDNELIVEYVRTYSSLCVNLNSPSWENRGTKRYTDHCHDLEVELVARGILTEDDVKYLNM